MEFCVWGGIWEKERQDEMDGRESGPHGEHSVYAFPCVSYMVDIDIGDACLRGGAEPVISLATRYS